MNISIDMIMRMSYNYHRPEDILHLRIVKGGAIVYIGGWDSSCFAFSYDIYFSSQASFLLHYDACSTELWPVNICDSLVLFFWFFEPVSVF